MQTRLDRNLDAQIMMTDVTANHPDDAKVRCFTPLASR